MDSQDANSSENSSSARLDGWKEIAAYLGRNIRTVQRWERELQLPVRRLGPIKGASVFALRSEVDAWLTSRTLNELANIEPTDSDATPADDAVQEIPERKSRLADWRNWLAYIGLAAIALAAIAFGAARFLRTRQPSNYRIEQNALILFDAEGHELWRKTFPALFVPTDHRRLVWIGDVNGDRGDEVLFEYHAGGDLDETALYCYSASGKQLWRFTPGHSVRTADESFEPPFEIEAFEVVKDFDSKFVVVSSRHYRHFPNQVAVLSPSGQLVGEYWHAGLLGHIAAADMNRDGKTELYLTGIDSQYKVATMVMLDLKAPSGASPESDSHFQLIDMPAANERARLFFRRTCISQTLEPYNEATDIRFEKDTIWVTVAEQLKPSPTSPGIAAVDYDLTPNLELRRITVFDNFSVIYKQLEVMHLLYYKFSNAEFEPLKNLNRP